MPGSSAGCDLPAKMIWIGRSAAGDQLFEQLQVAADQIGPFVGGEPPGEADRQHPRIERRRKLLQGRVGDVAAAGLLDQPVAGVGDQPALERLVRFPQFARRELLDRRPHFGFAGAQIPVERQHAVVQRADLRRQPGRHVNAVRDVPDRDFFFAAPRPEIGPHPAADDAVQARDGVRPPAELERQHRHAERFLLVLRLDAPQAHQRIVLEPQLVALRPEVLFDQLGAEAVVPGGDGSVRREGAHGRRLAQRLVERQVVFFHPLADDFEPGEGRVPFVHVDHARLDPHRRQGPHAADPQDDLLADARPLVAAVQPARQVPVFVAVLGDVGIEQVQRNAADVDLPDAGVNFPAAGIDADQHRLAVGDETPARSAASRSSGRCTFPAASRSRRGAAESTPGRRTARR